MTLALVVLAGLLGYRWGYQAERRAAVRDAENRERHRAWLAATVTLRLAARTGHAVTVLPTRLFVRELSNMTSEVVGSN